MAVGCGWQAFVANVNVGCYYVVGIPLGCVLGFKYNLGAKVKKSLVKLLDWILGKHLGKQNHSIYL